MKKTFIIIFLLFSFFNPVFSADDWKTWNKTAEQIAEEAAGEEVWNLLEEYKKLKADNKEIISAKADLDAAQKKLDNASSEEKEKAEEELDKAQKAYDAAWGDGVYANLGDDLKAKKDEIKEAQKKLEKAHKAACKASKSCLEDESFEITVADVVPGWVFDSSKWETMKQRTNWILWTIIEKLIIALWVISVLIMTVGWAYMILHSWQEGLLWKWKDLFMWWVYAMVIALSSYFIMAIVRYLIFN